MNCLKIGLITSVLLLSICSIGMAEKDAGSDKISWVRYEDGLKQARAEDKPVFIDFSTSWCGWCKKMNKTTFKEGVILDMLAENFVSVKVDGDSRRELDIDGYKITEQNLTRSEFQVRSYPTYYFLTPAGGKLGAARGYQNKDQLAQYLTYVSEKQYDTTKAQNPGQEKGGR